MTMHRWILLAVLGLGAAHGALAQEPGRQAPATAGTLVVVPANGEVKHANDEATIVFTVEEQDKDRAAATARANQKMKQGTDIVRAQDPQAELRTLGYSTFPVYAEVPDPPRPLVNAQARRTPIGWRVSQMLQMTTRHLDVVPKTVAAAQKVLNLNGVDYHVSRELARRLDDELIAATYRNLNERTASIARAMGRNVADATVETVDFEGSGNYERSAHYAEPMAANMRAKSADMPEPSFEPGETTLVMHMVGKVRFR